MDQAPCPYGADPTKLNNPQILYSKPRPLYRPDSQTSLARICPQYDPAQPLCCNDDQVEIMCKPFSFLILLANNFASIDLVFGNDCTVCAANLKLMWCEYTCNPNKVTFSIFNLDLILSLQSKEPDTFRIPLMAT